MNDTPYRLVPVGQPSPDAVTVGIELTADDGVEAALAAAEGARALHGFDEVIAVLSQTGPLGRRLGTTGIAPCRQGADGRPARSRPIIG